MAAMITVHIEFGTVGACNEHVINWLVGWLCNKDYLFGLYQRYRGSGSWHVDVYARRACRSVRTVDMFDFTLDVIDDMYCFLSEMENLDVTVSVCGGERCIYVDWDDVRRLREEEHEEIERRWDRIMDLYPERT